MRAKDIKIGETYLIGTSGVRRGIVINAAGIPGEWEVMESEFSHGEWQPPRTARVSSREITSTWADHEAKEAKRKAAQRQEDSAARALEERQRRVAYALEEQQRRTEIAWRATAGLPGGYWGRGYLHLNLEAVEQILAGTLLTAAERSAVLAVLEGKATCLEDAGMGPDAADALLARLRRTT